MIYFNDLPLDQEILKALDELKINYVFQPIFCSDGKSVFAREALMRPTEMTVTELIEEYKKKDKLHILEIATFFGAMQEYQLRGYTEYACLNSFPSEFFTAGEAKAFYDYYGDLRGVGIIEILEYPYISELACTMKKGATKEQRLKIAIDDFGTGLSNMDLVDMYSPDIIKLDRCLISDCDRDESKQENIKILLKEFHSRGMLVVAEGIERREEFEWLVDVGIDLFQGYYLARPA
ncbi:MAG: EAL domain-containing protein [Lachnospiraceae bacterium]|nr:EAL domain-containing protein [Lachnospiraceae bacterium]